MMKGSKYSMKPDYAIMSRIKAEEKLQNSESYDRKMKFIGVNANWFESQQKFEVKKIKKINDERIKKELLLTNSEIKLRRTERLISLYCKEAEE